MVRIGGRSPRTYVIGDTRRATSSRSLRLPSQASVNAPELPVGRWARSKTSVMPYQLTMAATFISAVDLAPVDQTRQRLPGHWRSRPAPAVSMPVVSARCPPAELPVTTMRSRSKPYSSALRYTQRSAQRQSSTAAGACATSASR